MATTNYFFPSFFLMKVFLNILAWWQKDPDPGEAQKHRDPVGSGSATLQLYSLRSTHWRRVTWRRARHNSGTAPTLSSRESTARPPNRSHIMGLTVAALQRIYMKKENLSVAFVQPANKYFFAYSISFFNFVAQVGHYNGHGQKLFSFYFYFLWISKGINKRLTTSES